MAARKKSRASSTKKGAQQHDTGTGTASKPQAARSAPGMSGNELEGELDSLYRAPLAGFIKVRKELVARLKETGDERASKVAKLAKPVVSAWATNALALQHPEFLSEIRAAGDQVRSVQSGGRGPDGLSAHQEAAQRRRQAIETALDAVEKMLEEAGHGAARQTLQRVRSSLESLAIFGTGVQPEPPPGRLAQDIEPPGLDVLAALELRPKGGSPRGRALSKKKAVGEKVLEFPRASTKSGKDADTPPRKSRATPAALRRSREALRRAEAGAREATVAVKNAQRSHEGAERSLERVRQRLVEAEARAERALGELDEACARRDRALAAVEAAKSSLGELET